MMKGGLAQLMKQAQKMQQQMLAAQEELANAQVDGSAGGGMVKATVSGAGDLLSLTIDPSVVDPEDVGLECAALEQSLQSSREPVSLARAVQQACPESEGKLVLSPSVLEWTRRKR